MTVTLISYSVRNYNGMNSGICTKGNLCQNILAKILKGIFVGVEMFWLGHFLKFIKQGIWNNNVVRQILQSGENE